ncbi:hypothetical protein P154DRAFT_520690 [Amniculicola lignicola CBS 123094]|uniref:Nucleolar protein NOP52 variant n=1 Tax=Amniculicola lignicola CBS 123094 TaxID=1392246 RepID=A0A6A5WN37_9PLEO|nr:hypothetical protein P154DRAFT_520690 [Amniculicola lignicola CBS 123094]
MASDAQNSPFIKHLASSDKDTRDQALDALRTFLSGRNEIAEIDLLKLWKGLFYCLWMQDKPILQQRLSRDFAGLVEVLKTDVVMPFLSCFWKTMAREWNGIEALRRDKYLFLVRQYLNTTFRYLSRNSWRNTAAVAEYTSILAETPLSSTNTRIPAGLTYHVLDCYVDELEKVAGEEMDNEVLARLLEPVEQLRTESKTKAVRNAAKECLDDDRLKVWRGEKVGGEEDVEMGDGEGDEWGGIQD